MRQPDVAVEGPGDRLGDRPAARPLAVEAELGGQAVEAVEHVAFRVAELDASARSARSRTRARRRAASGRSPATARAAPRGRCRRAGPDAAAPADPVSAAAPAAPRARRRAGAARTAGRTAPRSLRSESAHQAASAASVPKRRARRLPEPRQQLDEDVQRRLPAHRRERRPGTQRSSSSACSSGSESSSRTAPSPSQSSSAAASCSLSRCGCCTFSTACSPSARRHAARRAPTRKPPENGLAEGQAPARDQTLAGQRYASAWRFFSEGSFSRTERSSARSSSAVITVSSSGACASTIPHGSTISERP